MTDMPMTLLVMQQAPDHPSPLDRASLVVIDIQEEYRTGALPLANVDKAAAAAADVLALARLNGVPVFHVLHRVSGDAPIFNPSLPTYAEMPEIAAVDGEPIIVKTLPNAFAGTDLDAQLRATGRPEIIFVGMQTHMCISASARAALDLGYRSTVVADACATRDLPDGQGGKLEAEFVHRAALAELADAFATVVLNASVWRERQL